MSVWPIMLRLLLSITLVLNGVTAAVAGMHLEGNAAHPATPEAAAVALAATDPTSCHQPDQMLGSTAHAGHAVDEPAPADSPKWSSDCCDTGTCECACIQVAQLDFAIGALLPMVGEGSRDARRLPLGHAAPALPHLIRPPID